MCSPVYDEIWRSPDGVDFCIRHTADIMKKEQFRAAMEKSGWEFMDSQKVA